VRLDLLIPTYNRMDMLLGCLRSVMDARVPEGMEVTVMVIDNNSNDGTCEAVKSFSHPFALRLEYVFVKRQGKAAALNESVAASNAEFIGMVDDDELIDRGWFECTAREFSNDPELEYIGGPYYPHWLSEKPAWLPQKYPGVIGIVNREQESYFSRDFAGMLMGGNVVIRRSTLAKVMPYPEKYSKIGNKASRAGEDEVVYHRLLDLGAKGKVVPDLIIYHLIPPERLTKSYYRNWVWGRAMALGAQLREQPSTLPKLLGIPRYKFRAAAQGLVALFSRSSSERFTGELDVLDSLGTLYGRYFY
jgi:glycosyltransferase involved in cell wall biosynthesis